ncbi:hypothetical protein, partial [Staphylococcus capitis]|uniref:hypothetical protein n=1 Tax=Staphylococcus capitis TaxID=29388 RepID=UPI003D04F901
MTIYCTHPSRGKTQILATYRTPEDATTSCTVTSLDDPALAQSIVEALNRVSACATMPLCVYDRRGDGFGEYPSGHLAALADPAARAGLLTGSHSLWYELVMFELHAALTDLDLATGDALDPVKLAIAQELVVEARDLKAELLDYTENAYGRGAACLVPQLAVHRVRRRHDRTRHLDPRAPRSARKRRDRRCTRASYRRTPSPPDRRPAHRQPRSYIR